MANFVLVHGAWQGAWVWEGVRAGLLMHGHDVLTVDLPGSGADITPLDEVSLASYVERVQSVIESASAPVILVGHSMGGIVVSQVAERLSSKVARLVYLCAFLPCDGDTLMSLNGLNPSGHALTLEIDAQRHTGRLPSDTVKSTFLQDADTGVATWAAAKFKPQALAPLNTPLELTPGAYGTIPRDYVICSQDHAIAPALQWIMIQRAPCEHVYELDSGHCPFLSMPWDVVQLFDKIARVESIADESRAP